MTLYPSPIGHVWLNCIEDRLHSSDVDYVEDGLQPVPDPVSIRRDPRPPRIAFGSLALRRRPR